MAAFGKTKIHLLPQIQINQHSTSARSYSAVFSQTISYINLQVYNLQLKMCINLYLFTGLSFAMKHVKCLFTVAYG